jgi:nucleoside-diphosphate-sugar epimerase
MRIFVAGATGALGRALVPQLIDRGHEVVGMTRSESKQDLLRSLGARPVVADALDPDAVAEAVASAEPEVIVHQLTDLSGPMSFRDARHPERFSGAIMTNRLRTEGTAPIRSRRFPIVGDGGGVWSLIHIEDAAAATAIAVERGRSGVYDVVDDEPAPVRDWLPELAKALDAKPPRRIPRWLCRLLAGETATQMMTEAQGASNAKAKHELGWAPRYGSWRQGFAQGL